MARLIPAQRGNGRRPSDPLFELVQGGTGVVVLDVSDKTHELVGQRHDAAYEDGADQAPLLGAVVLLDNQAPADSSRPGPITVTVGASTLHEAATEVIACYEQLATEMPTWVASTDDELAEVVGEHFSVKGYSGCKVKPIEKAVRA